MFYNCEGSFPEPSVLEKYIVENIGSKSID